MIYLFSHSKFSQCSWDTWTLNSGLNCCSNSGRVSRPIRKLQVCIASRLQLMGCLKGAPVWCSLGDRNRTGEESVLTALNTLLAAPSGRSLMGHQAGGDTFFLHLFQIKSFIGFAMILLSAPVQNLSLCESISSFIVIGQISAKRTNKKLIQSSSRNI